MNSVSSRWPTNFHVHTGETSERSFYRLLARLDGGIRRTRMVGPAEQGRPLGPTHPTHQDMDEVPLRPALLGVRGFIPLAGPASLPTRLDVVTRDDWKAPERELRILDAVGTGRHLGRPVVVTW